MINLLPDNTKRQLRAARTNSSLIKYIMFLILSVIFLASVSAGSYLILNNSKTAAEKNIASSQTKSGSYLSVLNQANAISQNILQAKGILDKQISYSDIIIGLAKTLPEGVIINTLSLSDSTIGTPITIKALGKTSDDSTLLKTNMQKSTQFSNYNLKSVSTDPNDTTGHPILISFEITINKGVSL